MLDHHCLETGLTKAVQYFWTTREGQAQKQQVAGRRDQGGRSAVTGGKQMDGFVAIVRAIIIDAGLPDTCIHTSQRLELPGFYRAEKKWDLVVVDDNVLVAAVEFKSQIGPSFGNNFNNRSEEAIGTAQDIWTAYREGAFPMTDRPWLGYFMMLENCPRSTSSIAVKQPHFPVFREFYNVSYAERYQLLLTKLVRERLYDCAAFLMSTRKLGIDGRYSTPDPSLSFVNLATSLHYRVAAHLNSKKDKR